MNSTRNQEIAKLIQEGYSAARIAPMCGVSRQWVYYVAKKMGVEFSRRDPKYGLCVDCNKRPGQPHSTIYNKAVLCVACYRKRVAQRLAKKQWSLHYAQCTICNETKYRHQSRGICSRCCFKFVDSYKLIRKRIYQRQKEKKMATNQ